MDFVADELADGRRIRMLTAVDLFTRECLEIKIGKALRAENVVQVLNRLKYEQVCRRESIATTSAMHCSISPFIVPGLPEPTGDRHLLALRSRREGRPREWGRRLDV